MSAFDEDDKTLNEKQKAIVDELSSFADNLWAMDLRHEQWKFNELVAGMIESVTALLVMSIFLRTWYSAVIQHGLGGMNGAQATQINGKRVVAELVDRDASKRRFNPKDWAALFFSLVICDEPIEAMKMLKDAEGEGVCFVIGALAESLTLSKSLMFDRPAGWLFETGILS